MLSLGEDEWNASAQRRAGVMAYASQRHGTRGTRNMMFAPHAARGRHAKRASRYARLLRALCEREQCANAYVRGSRVVERHGTIVVCTETVQAATFALCPPFPSLPLFLFFFFR